jgi:hypothetical protein
MMSLRESESELVLVLSAGVAREGWTVLVTEDGGECHCVIRSTPNHLT